MEHMGKYPGKYRKHTQEHIEFDPKTHEFSSDSTQLLGGNI